MIILQVGITNSTLGTVVALGAGLGIQSGIVRLYR